MSTYYLYELNTQQKLFLRNGANIIGNGNKNSEAFNSWFKSKQHGEIIVQNNKITFRQLETPGQIFLNGQILIPDKFVVLQVNDIILITATTEEVTVHNVELRKIFLFRLETARCKETIVIESDGKSSSSEEPDLDQMSETTDTDDDTDTVSFHQSSQNSNADNEIEVNRNHVLLKPCIVQIEKLPVLVPIRRKKSESESSLSSVNSVDEILARVTYSSPSNTTETDSTNLLSMPTPPNSESENRLSSEAQMRETDKLNTGKLKSMCDSSSSSEEATPTPRKRLKRRSKTKQNFSGTVKAIVQNNEGGKVVERKTLIVSSNQSVLKEIGQSTGLDSLPKNPSTLPDTTDYLCQPSTSKHHIPPMITNNKATKDVNKPEILNQMVLGFIHQILGLQSKTACEELIQKIDQYSYQMDNFHDFETYKNTMISNITKQVGTSLSKRFQHISTMPATVTRQMKFELKPFDQNFVQCIGKYIHRNDPRKPKIGDLISIKIKRFAQITQFNGYIAETLFNAESCSVQVLIRRCFQSALLSTDEIEFRILSWLHFEVRTISALTELHSSPIIEQILNPSLIGLQYNEGCIYHGNNIVDNYKKNIIRKICESVQNNHQNIFIVKGGSGTGKTCTVVNLLHQLEICSNQKKKQFRALICSENEQALVATIYRYAKEGNNTSNLLYFETRPFVSKEAKDISFNSIIAKKHIEVRSKICEFSAEIEKRKDLSKLSYHERRREASRLEFCRCTLSGYEQKLRAFQNTNSANNYGEKLLQRANMIFVPIDNFSLRNKPNYTLKLNTLHFDACLILDASMIEETSMANILALNSPNLILVGDSDCRTPKAERKNAGNSLMHRLCRSNVKNCFTLSTQYRVNSEAFEFTKKYCYPGVDWFSQTLGSVFPFSPYLIFDLSVPDEQAFEKQISLIQKILDAVKAIIETRRYKCCIFTSENVDRVRSYLNFTNISIKNYGVAYGTQYDMVIVHIGNSIKSFDGIQNSQFANIVVTRGRYLLYVIGDLKNVKRSRFWMEMKSNAENRQVIFNLDSSLSNWNQNMLLIPNRIVISDK